MSRLRASTILRRFLDGESIGALAFCCSSDPNPHRYVEDCIRRGIRGEVCVLAERRKSQS